MKMCSDVFAGLIDCVRLRSLHADAKDHASWHSVGKGGGGYPPNERNGMMTLTYCCGHLDLPGRNQYH